MGNGMGLIQTFMEGPGGPAAFLARFVVIVGDEAQYDGKALGVSRFAMKQGPANIVYLERRFFGKTDGTEPAYWLPWKTGIGVALDLGDKADWLFTSEMTNCRFTILTEGDVAVKVAHLAGDINTGAGRTKWEENAKNGFITNPETQKARRLSRSANELGYVGNINDSQDKSSSAFVFGRRVDGAWKFYTQIAGGFRTVSNTRLLTENINIITTIASI